MSEEILAANSVINREDWLPYLEMQAGVRLRILCLHYAGGSASVYHQWQHALPQGVQVCALQLPGREARINERPYTSMALLITDLVQVIKPFLSEPFVVFGYSLGALIAFELTRQLRRTHLPLPQHLFLSVYAAPHLPYRFPQLHDMADEELIQALHQLKSIPEELFDNEAFMHYYLPVIRADFALCKHYIYEQEAPLDCSYTVFGGINDTYFSRQELDAWRMHTTGNFALRMFPGDHFFIHHTQEQLLSIISQATRRLMYMG